MNLYDETREILRKYNITANKQLGQNFLINEDVVLNIVNSAKIESDDLVIEIGPGLGTLTKELLKKAKKVICVELDKRMISILEDRFFKYNLEIINDDILKVNLKEIIEQNKKEGIKNVKIVANLPYYITTPIIMKLLEDRLDIESITVMIQKEVAERLTVTPGKGDTGAITYAISYYTNPSVVLNVPKESFIPAPEVESSVINLDVLEKPSVKVENEELLFKVIKIAFMQKRKTLLNSLTNGNLLDSKEKIEKMLLDLNIDLKIRPEKLKLEEFAKICNYVYNI